MKKDNYQCLTKIRNYKLNIRSASTMTECGNYLVRNKVGKLYPLFNSA